MFLFFQGVPLVFLIDRKFCLCAPIKDLQLLCYTPMKGQNLLPSWTGYFRHLPTSCFHLRWLLFAAHLSSWDFIFFPSGISFYFSLDFPDSFLFFLDFFFIWLKYILNFILVLQKIFFAEMLVSYTYAVWVYNWNTSSLKGGELMWIWSLTHWRERLSSLWAFRIFFSLSLLVWLLTGMLGESFWFVFFNTPKNLSFWRPKFFCFYDEFFGEFYSLNYTFWGSPPFWNGAQEFWSFTKFSQSVISQWWLWTTRQDGPRDHVPALVLFHGSVASADFVRCPHYAVLLNFSAFTSIVGVEIGS